jgi:hypothetical protein
MYSFPVGENEKILKKSMASVARGHDSYSGALYLTNERVVFVGYVLDINNKYLIEAPLEHIVDLKKEKTFFILSNAIAVTTIRDENFRIIVQGRDKWFQAINQQRSLIK